MLKKHATFLSKVMMLMDLLVITAAFFIAYYFRNSLLAINPLSFYLKLLPLILAIWISYLHIFGMYESFRVKNIPAVIFIIFKSSGLSFFTFGFFLYLLKVGEFSRSFVFLAFALAGVILVIEKVGQIIFLRQIRKKGLNYRNLLIIGTGKRAQDFIKLVDASSEWGFKIIGLIDNSEERTGEIINGHKIIGSFSDIPEIVHNEVVDEVVFILPRSLLNSIGEVIGFLETEGVKIHLSVDHFDLKIARAKISEIFNCNFVTFETAPSKQWSLLCKRIFDVVFSAIALIILSPLFGIIVLLVMATSKGFVFFRQERMGLHGRKFTMYKFRTMEKDAELQLARYLEKNEMSGPVFKLTNDPRVTKTGKWLRKFSLDELPQLWNILKGDMSLVGPRPPLISEVKKYDSWQRRRLIVRPGVTCLWQVNGRNNIADFNKWVKLDLEYIDNWSLGLDCKILLKTLPVVLFGSGAK